MSAILFAARRHSNVQQIPAGGGGGTYDIDVQWMRLAAGSASTLCAFGIELADGQLDPADIGNVSVWRDGAEVSVFLATNGVYPSGKARSLFVQGTAPLSSGTPIDGGIKLSGGAVVSRASYVDDSATWVNEEETFSAMRDAGLPAGIIVPTDAAHICAPTTFGWVQPSTDDATWTQDGYSSTDFDTNLAAHESYMFPIGTAIYNPCVLLYNQWRRTNDVRWLKDCLAMLSARRTAYWGFGYGLPEWLVEGQDQLLCQFLKHDQTWKNDTAHEWEHSANEALQFRTSYLSSPYTPRQWAGNLTAIANLMCTGGKSYYVNNTEPGDPVLPWVNSNWYAVPITYDAGGSAWQTNGRLFTTTGFQEDGVTPQSFTFAYWSAVYLHTLIRIWQNITDSGHRATLKTAILASIDWYIANMLDVKTASPHDSAGFLYSTDSIWVARRAAQVSGSYTAGDTTIALKNIAGLVYPGLDLYGTALHGNGAGRISTGSVHKRMTTDVTVVGNAATVSLESGFASNMSDGDTIYVVQCADALASASGEASIELTGLWPHLIAWAWWQTGTSSYKTIAKQLMISLVKPWSEGGPLVTQPKQFTETFSMSAQTFALLALGDTAWGP